MKPVVFLTVLLTFCCLGCKDYGVPVTATQFPTPFPSHWSFNYKAYDTLGMVSATGTMYFTIYNSHVTGSWRFDDGRQGTLAGTSDKQTIQIDLYPGYADHNLILTGKLSAKMFSGEWVMYGWAILGRGLFIATVNAIVITD